MKRSAVVLLILFVGLMLILPQALAGSSDNVAAKNIAPMLKQIGTRHMADDSVGLCAITFGDTSLQDAKWNGRNKVFRGKILGPFSLNAAHYARNHDGTWRMWNLRPPAPEQMMEWVDYLARPEVMEYLENLDKKAATDFGGPQEFIYARARVPVLELPAPLNRLSAETLASFISIFYYNEDGTMRIELADPYWESPKALMIFERVLKEIE